LVGVRRIRIGQSIGIDFKRINDRLISVHNKNWLSAPSNDWAQHFTWSQLRHINLHGLRLPPLPWRWASNI
jgi:hypothetical protein